MLKFKVAKLEDVPEQFRSLYSQGSDNMFYLVVEGAVDKARLDEFRDNNIKLKNDLDAYKGVDPKKVHDLMSREQQINDGKLIAEGKVEELIGQRVSAMKADHEKVVTGLQGQLSVSNRQLETLVVDNAVREHAIKLGVQPTAVDDVLLRAKTVFRVEGGKPIAKDADGNIVYGKDGQTSVGIGDWIGGLKEQAPHLFVPSTGSGANTHNGSHGRQNTQGMSATDKIGAGLAGGSSILT